MEIDGGARLNKALDEISRRLNSASAVAVGFFANATYPDGTSVAMVAAIQNFGSGRIPPRPFFSNMIRDKAHEWGPALGQLIVRTNYNADRSLAILGDGIAGQLRQSIRDTNTPPLAPATLRKRGYKGAPFNPNDPKTFGAKPLVHTGVMLGSVSYEVR